MSNEISSAPATGKKSYRVRVDMAFSMNKEFYAASETEAREVAKKEIKDWTLEITDGWEGDNGKAVVTVEQL